MSAEDSTDDRADVGTAAPAVDPPQEGTGDRDPQEGTGDRDARADDLVDAAASGEPAEPAASAVPVEPGVRIEPGVILEPAAPAEVAEVAEASVPAEPAALESVVPVEPAAPVEPAVGRSGADAGHGPAEPPEALPGDGEAPVAELATGLVTGGGTGPGTGVDAGLATGRAPEVRIELVPRLEIPGGITSVGPYRLAEQLGEGGMGVVYRGVDESGADVAVKMLKPQVTRDATFRRRLVREVETMRRIRSPYVAGVLDAELQGGRPYIVTQYVAGHPLDETVQATGPLSGRLLSRVALGLAEALAAIHGAGVVHRDLKPNNVMLLNGRPVVIDFGIAHTVDATRLTQTGMVVGTPGYMAPEVIDGNRAGPPVDVYGWGATVVFAATGHSPFGSGSVEAVVARIVGAKPDLTGMPPELLEGVRATLTRDPSRRPTAAELVEWLRRVYAAMEAWSGTGAFVAPPAPGHTGGPAPVSPPPLSRPPVSPPPLSRPPVSPVSLHPARRVGLGWYKLIAYLLIFAMVCAAVVSPVVGGAAAVLAAWYLRAGDSAVRSRRVPVRGTADLVLAPLRLPRRLLRSATLTAVSLCYPALAAAVVVVGLLAVHTIFGTGVSAGTICSWGIGAFTYVVLAGAGLMGPRRQLVRLSSAAARRRSTVVLALLLTGSAAVLAFGAAWTSVQHWWPVKPPYPAVRHLGDLIDQRLNQAAP